MSVGTKTGLSAPLRVREFRYLWAAELSSVVGDQLARVALAVLVYAQTASAALTALTYALTFVPSLLGGMLLSGLADRFPRRRVLVVTDVVRAVLAAAMAVPSFPLPVLWGLVAVLSAAAGPFKAAQLAVLPQILTDKPVYRAGLALRQVTAQTAQLVGFAAGGVLLTVIEPHLALLLNAATFVVSAALVLVGVRDRRAAASPDGDSVNGTAGMSGSVWPVFVLASLVGLYVVPEGIAAPYADGLGLTAVGVGVLMAADPVGSVLGGWLTTRLKFPTSLTVATLLAVAAGLPLVVCLLAPGLVWSAVLWAVSGLFSTMYLVQIQELVVDRVPDSRRGGVMGRLATCAYSSQGIAIVGGGVAAEAFDSFRAVALAGMLAVVLAGLFGAVLWAARSRRALVGNEPNTNGIQDTNGIHQRSLLAISGTSSPGTDCQPNPGVEEVAGDQGSGGDTSSPSTSATQHPAGREVPQQPVDVQRSGWRLWRLSGPARGFLIGVEVVAVVATVVLAIRYPVTADAAVYFAIIVVLGLLVAEATRGVERMRRRFSDTPHVNMSSVWTLSAALLTTPALAAATTMVLYLHLWWRSWHKITGMHPFRVVFSVCAVVLSCHAAFVVDLMLPGPRLPSAGGLEAVVGLLVVIVVYWIVNSSLVGGAIALLRSVRSLGQVLGSWRENSLEYATLSVGATTTLLLFWNPWAVVFVGLPLYLLHRNVLVRQLEDAATTDSKTGLLNAGTWQSLAAKEVERAQRHNTRLGLLMIDVDHFKSVNDRYSHLVGDQALHAIADVLRSSVRNYDLVGRFGGEEFVILLVGTDHAGSVDVGHRICERVRDLRIEDALTGGTYPDLHLSVSVGVAMFPDAGTSLQDVLLAADNAVFAAKDAGRDQVLAIQPASGQTDHDAGSSPL